MILLCDDKIFISCNLILPGSISCNLQKILLNSVLFLYPPMKIPEWTISMCTLLRSR